MQERLQILKWKIKEDIGNKKKAFKTFKLSNTSPP